MGDPAAPLLVEDRGSIRLMTLNRPQVRNAIDDSLAAALDDALADLESEESLGVGVLTGSPPGFCSGMDLKAFAAGERAQVGDGGFAGIVRRRLNKPIIAAVEGFAIAGGLEIALACDIIVAGEDAIFGLPEASRGIIAAAGGLLRLPAQIPYHVATDMILTGESISATRAHSVGLVSRLTAPGLALQESLALAQRVAAHSKEAIAASKRVLPMAHAWPSAATWAAHDAVAAVVLESREATDGAVAFTRHGPHQGGSRSND